MVITSPIYRERGRRASKTRIQRFPREPRTHKARKRELLLYGQTHFAFIRKAHSIRAVCTLEPQRKTGIEHKLEMIQRRFID